MKGMRLNVDLFVEILAHVQSSTDLWSISRGSQATYRLATDEVLRRHIALRDPRQLAPFFQFVSKDGERREALVRNVSIHLQLRGDLDVGVVADILSHCRCIQRLLVGPAIRVDEHPQIRDAICALSELRVLSVSCNARDMLANLRTRHLVAVEVQGPATESSDDFSNAFAFLGEHASTLRTILFRNLSLNPPSHGAISYPNVTTLGLTQCLLDYPNIASLASTFTNVRNLLLGDTDVVQEHMPAGMAAKDNNENSWKQLEYFEGTLATFQHLGLPCAVRHVEMSNIISGYDPDEVESLSEIIVKARVARLSMEIVLESPEDFERFMPKNGRSTSTHLSLRVEVSDMVSDEADTIPVSADLERTATIHV